MRYGWWRKLQHRVRVWRAMAVRRLLPRTRWVAITGSVGKTTSAAMISAALGAGGPGLHYSFVGGAFTVDRLCRAARKVRPWHRHAVLEVSGHIGAPGVAKVARILKPHIAVITTIRDDHRGIFGTPEGAAEAKAELVRALRPRDVAILNADDPLVWAMRHQTRARVIGVGRSPEATVRLLEASARWPDRLTVTLQCEGRTLRVPTRFVGEYAALPVLCGIAAALALGLDLEAAAARLAEVPPVDGRMCPHETPEGITFIDNAWKSPMHAVPTALQFLAEARTERRVVVIGAISDFSGGTGMRYRRLAREALEIADVVVFSGRWQGSVKKVVPPPGKQLLTFASTAAVRAGLRELLRRGDLVLLLGSTRMDHFDRLVYDRTGTVTCWSSNCRRWLRCNLCPHLSRPRPVAAAAPAGTAVPG